MPGLRARLLRSPTLWGGVAALVRSGAGILVLPLALRTLRPEEMGLWYVLAALGVFVARLDFGVSPAVSRGVAYLLAGADRVDIGAVGAAAGADPAGAAARVRSFVASVFALLRWLALGGVALMAVFRLLWHDSLGSLPEPGAADAAWWIFAIAVGLNLWGGVWQAVAIGAGLVREAQQAATAAALCGAIVTAGALLAGLGLVALALGFLCAGLVLRGTCLLRLRRLRPEILPGRGERGDRAWLAQIWPMAWRTGLIGLGAFLIYNANTFTAARRLGLEDAGSYGLSVQLLTFAVALAQLPVAVASPRFCALWARDERAALRADFVRRNLASVLLFAVAAAGLLLVGPQLLAALGTRTPLLPLPILAPLALVYLLELHHGNHAALVLAASRAPFTAGAVLSGIAIAILGWACAGAWGALGLVAAQGLVQAAYNNWYPVIAAWRLLRGGPAGGATAARADLQQAPA